MPTYEFRCPAGHDFEKFYRSIAAAPKIVVCPVCGKIAERQLSAGAGLVFKGSGFYITDYGKDGKKDQTAPAAAKDGGSSGEGGAKTDSSGTSGGDAPSKPGSDAKAATPAPSTEKPASKKAKDTE
jgi:putative FmdB family regulatory protein